MVDHLPPSLLYISILLTTQPLSFIDSNQFFLEITTPKAPSKQLSRPRTMCTHAQPPTSHSVIPHPHSHALLPPPCFLPPPPLPLLLHWSCSLAPLLCLSLCTFFFLRFTFFCPCLFSAQPPPTSPASLTRRLAPAIVTCSYIVSYIVGRHRWCLGWGNLVQAPQALRRDDNDARPLLCERATLRV